MRIRREQILAFEEVRMPDFENEMVAHLEGFSPLHSQSLGDEGIRRLIRMGTARAKNHGMTYRGSVKFYIETVILLGIDFDTDPQYPWPGAILRDARMPDQMQRADRVHEWLMELLERVGGPDRQYAKQALRRARNMPYESIPVSSPDFDDEAIRQMRNNHPEKVAYLGEAILRRLIPRAVEETKKYAVSTDLGVSLFLALMFALGHGFAGDPKYPWVAGTLTNPAIIGPEKRLERLYSKTMTYLDHVFEHLEGR